MWVGISSVGAFETAGRRRDLGDAQHGRAGRLHARGPAVPRVRPVRPQAGDGRRRRRAPLPAEPLRRLPLDATAARSGRRSRAGLPTEFGFPMGAHPRDPKTVWTIPLTGPTRAATCPRATPPSGGRTTAATLDAQSTTACRSTTPTSACCARRWRSTGSIRPASTSGRARASCTAARDEGRTLAPHRRQPAGDLVGRGRGRRLTRVPRRRSAMADRPPAALARGPVPGHARGGSERGGATVAERHRGPRRPGPGHPQPRRSTPARASARTSTSSSPASARRSRRRCRRRDVHVIPAVSGG